MDHVLLQIARRDGKLVWIQAMVPKSMPDREVNQWVRDNPQVIGAIVNGINRPVLRIEARSC